MTIESVRTLVRALLEIPSGSSWDSSDIDQIILMAYKSVLIDLALRESFYNITSETVTITTEKEYTLTNEYSRIINIYNDNEDTYEIIDPASWPTARTKICWYDRKNKKLKFFRTPEVQTDFTVLGPGAINESDFGEFPYEYEHILALKTAILIGKSEKEQIDNWIAEYDRELFKVEELVSKERGPLYVRQTTRSDNWP